jgi:hypothetical protein
MLFATPMDFGFSPSFRASGAWRLDRSVVGGIGAESCRGGVEYLGGVQPAKRRGAQRACGQPARASGVAHQVNDRLYRAGHDATPWARHALGFGDHGVRKGCATATDTARSSTGREDYRARCVARANGPVRQ